MDHLDWLKFDETLAELGAIPFTSRSHRDLSFYLQARAALVRGDQRRLLRRMDRAAQSRSESTTPLHTTLLGHAEGELALSIGDVPRARAALPPVGDSYLHAHLRARVHLASGAAGVAVRQLVHSTWLDDAPRRGRIELRLTLAAALDRTGETDEAARTIRHAVTQAGTPTQIAYSLAAADRESLQSAAERDAAIAAALSSLDNALFMAPFDNTGQSAALPLTRREGTILELLATGMTAAEIAARLFVSVHTVRNQTQRIYRKLNVTSRDQAVKIATRYGHLQANDSTGNAAPQ
ncbi:helix-turn-helix transcriptional regulator [Georgenia halophila]|uniref:helix-turn-helix transcriptional regulator n=1 Tax=Georgenia halophila TaxID=620889 RepID=UPI0031E8B081